MAGLACGPVPCLHIKDMIENAHNLLAENGARLSNNAVKQNKNLIQCLSTFRRDWSKEHFHFLILECYIKRIERKWALLAPVVNDGDYSLSDSVLLTVFISSLLNPQGSSRTLRPVVCVCGEREALSVLHACM